MAGLAKLCQDGGTNKNKQKLVRNIEGYTFDWAVLRECIHFHQTRGTVRQLAKTYRRSIAKIYLINSWPGPLLADLRKRFPEVTISSPDSIYCSEIFSGDYHPDVPAYVRELLSKRETAISYEKRQTPNQVKKKGGKKKK